ncbi:hypothetical protein L596_023880 [Steinernema carpocapsae]|uniref:Uncharacterized protein n=1 Tax=Steinernema carpocapsae TaxID=34508 RepID=A0A4U5MF28_STECR|nr:hypothetical protein L596_023880 [Steinernema carpocapsae]
MSGRCRVALERCPDRATGNTFRGDQRSPNRKHSISEKGKTGGCGRAFGKAGLEGGGRFKGIQGSLGFRTPRRVLRVSEGERNQGNRVKIKFGH